MSLEATIRRHTLIVSAVLCAALLAATSAFASVYRTSSLRGSQTSSRSATGSCSTAAGLHKDVLLRCSSSTGSATVSYTFSVPAKAGSIIFCPVPAVGSTGNVAHQLTRTGTKVTVTVTVQGAHAHFDILSTWIGYYVRSGK